MADQNVTLGIDLGTTNSAVAITEAGQAEILENKEGDRTTPSVVRFSEAADEEDASVVGTKAQNRAMEQPGRTIASIKRHMGEDGYTATVDGEDYKPEEISAYILSKLRSDTADRLGMNESSLNSLVVTVPAYFTEDSRQSTRDASKIAGFEDIEIINEPSASAMAYGYRESSDRITVLVYDLGGGTFDVSVLTIGDGMFEVKATNGIRDLGGDDWDERIVDWLREEFESEHGADPLEGYESREEIKESGDAELLERANRLYEEARARKEEIGSQGSGQVRSYIVYLAEVDGDPKTLETNLSHQKFQEITEDLIQQTVDPTLDTIDEAGYKASEIDEVLLIGGSTRMKQVEEVIEQTLNQEPNRTINPDEAVAQGAAIKGNQDDVLLQEVTPLSLGVAVKSGNFERLIERNTTLPAEEQKMFTTAEDGHTSVRIDVYQGEREIAEKNRHLKEFYLDGIPPQPRGMPSIRVTFRVGPTGLVTARAKDIKGQGGERVEEVTIEGSNNLSDNEIDQLIRKADEKQEEDERDRRLRAKRQEAKQRLNDAQTLISNHRAAIPDEEVEQLERRMNRVKNGLDDETITANELANRVDDLFETVLEIGEQTQSRKEEASPKRPGDQGVKSPQTTTNDTTGATDSADSSENTTNQPTAASHSDQPSTASGEENQSATASPTPPPEKADSGNEEDSPAPNAASEKKDSPSQDKNTDTGSDSEDAVDTISVEQSNQSSSEGGEGDGADPQSSSSTDSTEATAESATDSQDAGSADEALTSPSEAEQSADSSPPDTRSKTTNPDFSSATAEYSTSESSEESSSTAQENESRTLRYSNDALNQSDEDDSASSTNEGDTDESQAESGSSPGVATDDGSKDSSKEDWDQDTLAASEGQQQQLDNQKGGTGQETEDTNSETGEGITTTSDKHTESEKEKVGHRSESEPANNSEGKDGDEDTEENETESMEEMFRKYG